MVKPATQRILILDSLRGLAAMIVCFHHLFSFNQAFFVANCSNSLYNIMEFISDQNPMAVLFFFILSGFSIGLSLKNRPTFNRSDINVYLYRRFKRILPIYWLAILVSLLVGYIIGQQGANDFSVKNLLGNMLFLQTTKSGNYWFSPYGLNGPLWSLSYEMFFYLIFPLCFWLNRKYFQNMPLANRYFILLVICTGCIAINKFVFVPYFLFFGQFCIWILGYINSRAYVSGTRYDQLFISILCFALVSFALSSRFIHSDTLLLISKGLLLACLFYFVQITSNSFILRIFAFVESVTNWLFHSIGKGSYALYAIHYPFFLLFGYFHVSFAIQVILFALLTFVCIKLEEWTVKQKFDFFNLNYSGLLIKRPI